MVTMYYVKCKMSNLSFSFFISMTLACLTDCDKLIVILVYCSIQPSKKMYSEPGKAVCH